MSSCRSSIVLPPFGTAMWSSRERSDIVRLLCLLARQISNGGGLSRIPTGSDLVTDIHNGHLADLLSDPIQNFVGAWILHFAHNLEDLENITRQNTIVGTRGDG